MSGFSGRTTIENLMELHKEAGEKTQAIGPIRDRGVPYLMTVTFTLVQPART